MSDASLSELKTALTTASDLAGALAATPSRRGADQLVATLRHALDVASSWETPAGPTGCALHPNGAVDPLYGDPDDPLPPGYGRCLLCNDRRRRADAHPRLGWRQEVPTRALWRRTA